MQVFSRLAKANMNKMEDHAPWSFVYEFRNGLWTWTINVDTLVATETSFGDVIEAYNEYCEDRPWLKIGLAELAPIEAIVEPLTDKYSRMILMPLEDAAYGMLFMGFDRISTQPKTLIYLDQETCQSWTTIRRVVHREVLQHVE